MEEGTVEERTAEEAADLVHEDTESKMEQDEFSPPSNDDLAGPKAQAISQNGRTVWQILTQLNKTI